MTKVEKLENEAHQLNPDELAAFRDWFRRYEVIQMNIFARNDR
jgi:hypothetical protein